MHVGILNAPRHRTRLSGEWLTSDRLELQVLPGFGCHWGRLRASVKGEWVDLLKPVGDGDALLDGPTHHGCFLEAPWSRGDVYQRPWTVAEASRTRFSASLESLDFRDFNFPRSLRFAQRMEVRDERLEVCTRIENVDQLPAPAGLGFYAHVLRRPTWKDEDVLLHVPAARWFPRVRAANATSPPHDTRLRDNDETAALQAFRALGERTIDHCYTSFEERHIRVIYPGSRVELRFEMDENFGYATVNTAPRTRSRLAPATVAIRLATHAAEEPTDNQGSQDKGLRILQPGETWETRWTLSVGDI